MTLRGDLGSMNAIKKKIRSMPVHVARSVAQRAAPAMTDEAQGAYDAARTVYDAPRPVGVDGQQLSLVRTGATRRDVSFRSLGTTVYASLGTKYARYLIGKYDILPNGPIPVKWRERLARIVGETPKP